MYQLEVKPVNAEAYENKDLACVECAKVFNPSKDGSVKSLFVPALLANTFCSRSCMEKNAARYVKP